MHPKILCCEWKKTESPVWQYFDYKCPSQNSMLWVKKTGSTVWQCSDQCCLLYWKISAQKKLCSTILIKEHFYLQHTVCCTDRTWNREALFPILGVLRSGIIDHLKHRHRSIFSPFKLIPYFYRYWFSFHSTSTI